MQVADEKIVSTTGAWQGRKLVDSIMYFETVKVGVLTSSTQKLKLMEEVSQSTYTLQHPHSRAIRKDANEAREKCANMKINGWGHK
jgi:hypothetical protein